MSTQTADNSLDPNVAQTLNKTDMGHFIFEHRKSLVAALIVVFVGAVIFMFYRQNQQQTKLKLALELHQFESTVVKDMKENKLSPEDFLKQFQALRSELKTQAYLIPMTMELTKYLADKGQSDKALILAQEIYPHLKDSVAQIYLGHQLAALAEDNSQFDLALSTLEKLTQSKEKVLLTKTYLDLGRLAKKLNQKDKADKYFNLLVKDYPNDEYTKLARLYLAQP
jgi:predicted negative regulator of RcsB-dependent stress response